ncbi:MAG: FtsX-like permease family protein [Planctomycetota bacterium]
MRTSQLVFREIRHRKLSFAIGALSIAGAVGCVIASLLSLDAHDVATRQILDAQRTSAEAAAKKLEDDYRKIMKKLGHNVLILPADQNLADLHADNYASKYMPESYADRLAASPIITVNHLLPSLQQKVRWPEQKRDLVLIGTKGQVPIQHRDPKKPIQESVPAGKIVLGSALAKNTGLKVGDSTKLMGETFEVSKVHKQRGSNDDITAWIPLDTAQKLLGKEDRINGILALECNCPGNPDERLETIRKEIVGILPDTQVVAMHSKALARAEARRTAKAAAKQSLEREETNRATLRAERERFTAAFVPIVLLAAIVWIGFLALGNFRERSSEVGILRAIGLRSRDILQVFLGRSLIMGTVGAVLGCAAGLVVAMSILARDAEVVVGTESLGGNSLVDLPLLAIALIASPGIALLATWIPAQLASGQDPAVVLRKD